MLKYPSRGKELNRRKIYLILCFQKVHLMVIWPYVLWHDISVLGACGTGQIKCSHYCGPRQGPTFQQNKPFASYPNLGKILLLKYFDAYYFILSRLRRQSEIEVNWFSRTHELVGKTGSEAELRPYGKHFIASACIILFWATDLEN